MSKEIYSITPDGDLTKCADTQSTNKSTIIVDDAARKIYLFIPEEAPVREKFIAARLATEIKRKNGLVYKIQNVDSIEVI